MIRAFLAYHLYRWLPPFATRWGRLNGLREWAGRWRP